jgi:hypothetical protein
MTPEQVDLWLEIQNRQMQALKTKLAAGFGCHQGSM